MSNTIALYPLSNFTFSTKEAQPEEDPSVSARLQRLQNNYEDFGMRRTVEGILVVHDHGHPHILMLQIANAFFKLPGDYLLPGEDEISGLKKRLDDRLAPPASSGLPSNVTDGAEWEIGDCLAQWWRPNFETFMYPFVPAHITKPKECKKLFVVQMPEKTACHPAVRAVRQRCAIRPSTICDPPSAFSVQLHISVIPACNCIVQYSRSLESTVSRSPD
ncbi:nucleotide hydrolase-domain-containing protein [Mycena maculata]|uniref:Nucleotide hydrolase-domain-containing protein n=1 Tax=Mycena maculata TaxID=230809 RepID=A0AAD7IPF5_9AGAR|nr:nucleotide hydrolase-domain-containing protein [Mycena maculata]